MESLDTLTHLACRDLGHAWEPRTASRTPNGYNRVMICIRCATERVQRLDSLGYPLGAAYGYPDGYLAPKGSGRMTKHQRGRLRLRQLEHWSITATADQ